MSWIKQPVTFDFPIPSKGLKPVLIGNLEIDAIVNFYDSGFIDGVDYNAINWNGTCIYSLLQNFPNGEGWSILYTINSACEELAKDLFFNPKTV